jgi:PAS domain S-box-containing protein
MDKPHLNFLDVLMQLPCNVYWVDKQGVTLGCNQNVADFLKIDSVDDVIGKTHQELYGKELADQLDALLHKVVSTGKSIQVQEYAKLTDGRTYCFQSYKAPLKNDQGDIIGLIGISFDITKDKTEINFLKHIITMLPGHVWWTDEKSQVLGCNLQMAKTFGFDSVEEVLGMTAFDLLKASNNLPEQSQWAEDIDQNDISAIESGKAIEMEEQLKIDGKIHSYLTSKVPLNDLDGNIIGLIGVAQDQTETKNEREILKHVLAILPGHIWWTDKDSVILGCNDLMAQRFGYAEAKDLIAKSTFELMPDDLTLEEKRKFTEDLDNIDKQVMETEVPFIGEEFIEIDDELKTYYSHKRPIKDLDGNVSGIVGIAQDITDLKAAQEKAERASHVKSEFIANMSHDFRTPITGMLGEAEYIETHASDKEIQECGKFLREATQQLLRLTNSILEFVSLESGHIDEPVTVFNPVEVLEQVMTLMRVSLRHKDLEFSLHVSSGVPKIVKGYAQSFERIVNNLVANAIKFTAHGFVNLHLSVCSEISDEVTLKLVVEDTGMGIPANKYEEIFEQFSKISASYQGLFDGTGLGLYAVKQYVGQMQGRIEVDSIVGKGTKFIVSLPFDKAEAALAVPLKIKKSNAPIQVNQESCVVQLHPVQHKKAKVLVVEDAPLPARAVIRLLHDFDCEVKLVQSGEEAVKTVLKKPYDLILMDIGLPGIDGVEATRQIRALPHHNAMPIVALTGHVRGNKLPECIEAGMQEVYSKPLSRNQLKSLLTTYVETNSTEGIEPMKTPFPKHILDIDGMMALFLAEEPVQLLDMFEVAIDYLPEELQSLKKAVDDGNIEAIKASLHSLKGGVAYITAPECNDLISNWDETLRHENLDKSALQGMYANIEESLETLRKAMQQAVALIQKPKG